ncbi:MAG: nucleotidyltransferase family protein [Candidatus Omnitrophica bacterium]|nr:nucleotidyltransferase family protein [Candidatus Omnitrophota bacterium]
MKALVLAAGEGRRLGALTADRPKPMLPIGGVPVLERTLRWLALHGIRQIAINLHHQPHTIRAHVGDGRPFGVQATYSLEPRLLGTAGAVRPLARWLDEPFLVVYGDNLFEIDLTAFIASHRRHGGDGTIALHHREDPTASGIAALDGEGRLTRFVEKPSPDQVFSHWVSAGLMVWEPRVVADIPTTIPCDWGRDLLPQWATAKRIYGYQLPPTDRIWWMDTPEDYARAQAAFAATAHTS